MRKLFSLIAILILCSGLLAKSRQLHDFSELMEELLKGEQISAVIHYGDCKLMIDGEEVESPDAIGGMKIDTFEYFAPGSIGNETAYVVFSKTKLINLGGYVYNYAKIRVYADSRVEITAQYVDPQSYEISMDETFISEINHGENDGAVFFYLNK